ncbi:MAG: AI-2E family transporter [Acidobacteriaceae bacterium]|nr:AI-2E family transporter [Acidobacteriaceae bacterium]
MTSLQPTASVRTSANPGVTVLAFAAGIALLYFFRVFFITLLAALIICFILDPLVSAGSKLRLPRPVASFIVCSIALLFVYLMGLGIYTEMAGLAEDLPNYSQRVNAIVDSVATRMDRMEKTTYELVVPKRFQQPTPEETAAAAAPKPASNARRKKPDPAIPPPIQEVRIRPEPTPIWTYVYGYIVSFYDVLLMASFVPFLVYFMLSWRDHVRRSFLHLFQGETRQVVAAAWDGVAEMARGYVLGNFVLGLMLSVATTSFLFSIRLPYWPIVGPLSSFLSLVPNVGLPLAIIPPVVSGLTVYDQPAMYLVIGAVIALLHLTAMNLLYPKVIGSRVHLNPIVVTIGLMFWGTLWGGIGLVLAIPITAGVKAVCDNVQSLQPFGKLLGD